MIYDFIHPYHLYHCRADKSDACKILKQAAFDLATKFDNRGVICLKSAERDACALAGLRVIIIEDEAMLALCLGEVIEDEGFVVVGTAGTLAEAHSLATTAAFDVAIVDLHLYGQKADDVAASIVRSGHAVIISTGSDASAVPAAFHQWPVLRKPYGDAEIVSAIKSAAETRSLQDPHRSLEPCSEQIGSG